MALNKIYPKSESVCVLLAAQGSARSPEYRFVFAYNRFEIISSVHWSFHYRSKNM